LVSIAGFVTTTTEFSEVLDVIVGLIPSVHHICNIGIALHVIVHVIAIIIHITTTAPILLDDSLLELELIVQYHLTQPLNESAHALTMPGLKLAGRHVQFNTHFLKLQNHVLRGCCGVIVLVPPGYLLSSLLKEPGN
jgi:hypothetical protein